MSKDVEGCGRGLAACVDDFDPPRPLILSLSKDAGEGWGEGESRAQQLEKAPSSGASRRYVCDLDGFQPLARRIAVRER